MGTKWSEERAWKWYNSRPWLRGCNYMSADCANCIILADHSPLLFFFITATAQGILPSASVTFTSGYPASRKNAS